jgi:hypothetical protein
MSLMKSWQKLVDVFFGALFKLKNQALGPCWSLKLEDMLT